MTNPASELAFLLENWRIVPNGRSVYALREMDEQTDDQWRLQVRAAELLSEIDRALEALSESGQNVDHYRKYFVGWARAVFVPDFNWVPGMNGTTAVFEEHLIPMLKATADLLARTDMPVSVTPESRDGSLDALDQIVAALKDAPLAEPVRRYVFELISSCRTVLQESDTLGSVDLFARIHELVGVLTLITQSMMDTPETAPWAEKIRNLSYRLVPYYSAAKAAGFALGAVADLRQITDGS